MKRLCVCVTAVLGIGFSPIQLCVSGIGFSPIQLRVGGIGFPPHTAVRQWHRGFSPYIYVLVALRFSPIHLCVIGVFCFFFIFFLHIHLCDSGIGIFSIHLCVGGIGVFPHTSVCQWHWGFPHTAVCQWHWGFPHTAVSVSYCTRPSVGLFQPFGSAGEGRTHFLRTGAGGWIRRVRALFREIMLCVYISDTQQQQQQTNKQTNL